MAASQAHPSAPSLADLPDELLVACFAQLEDPLERRRVLPLVCPRWRRLADDPSLIRSFHLKFRGTSALLRLAAFRGWLEQSGAGAAVRSLRLRASSYDGNQVASFGSSVLKQLHSELLCALAACSGLQELRCWTLDLDLPPVAVGRLANALPHLRLLHLSMENTKVLVEAPLGALTQLYDLRLTGDPVRVRPNASLPLALTRLRLGYFQEGQAALPAQLTRLSHLAHLELLSVACEPQGFEPLSHLTSLSALGLSGSIHLPPPEVLRPLSNLRLLFLNDCESTEGEVGVGEVLDALPQLTALNLHFMPHLPEAVTRLAHLQRCVWYPGPPADWQPAGVQLPGGPWLANLRKLMLPSSVAVASTHVLRQATQLEHLGLLAMHGDPPLEAAELFSLVGQLTSLRSLQLKGPAGISQADVAAERIPNLCVKFTDYFGDLVRAVVPEFLEDDQD